MNVLMMISKNDKYGAQRVFLDQVQAVQAMGAGVVVVGRGNEGFVPDTVKRLGIPYTSSPLSGLKDLAALMRIVRIHDCDIIHTSLDRADHFGTILSCLTKRPHISTMNVRRYHIGYRLADAVITVSNLQRDLLIRKGVRAERVMVLRPWIDTERYMHPDPAKQDAWSKRLHADNYSMIFCHISSLLPQKGHLVSIDLAAACMRKGEMPLLIVAGDPLEGAYYDSLVRRIDDLGLRENVVFTGWTAEIPELLSLSDFTLLPSVHEAFGMVLLEGMAAGTPIVASAGEGGAELVEEYGVGFLYRSSETVDDLADRILSVWRSPGSYDELSARCSAAARQDFSVERYGSRLMDRYAALVRRTGHS